MTSPTAHTDPAWYRIDLCREEYEGGEAEVIESAFRQIYFAANAPLGMALLSPRHPGRDSYSLYLAPRSLPYARALVQAYDAVPLTAPPPEALALRVGDAAAAALFFKTL